MALDKITFNPGITSAARTFLPKDLISRLQEVKQIFGYVQKVEGNKITIRTDYGSLTIPYNPKFVVNQSISIGLFDLPDRRDEIELQIRVSAVREDRDQEEGEYKIRIKKEDHNVSDEMLDLETRATSTEDIIEHKNDIHSLSLLSEEGNKEEVVIKFTKGKGDGEISLEGNKVVIKKGGNKFYSSDVPDGIKSLLSRGSRNIIIQSYSSDRSLIEKYNLMLQNSSSFFIRLSGIIPSYNIYNDYNNFKSNFFKFIRTTFKQLYNFEEDDTLIKNLKEQPQHDVEGFKTIYLPFLSGKELFMNKFLVSDNAAESESHFSRRFVLEFKHKSNRNLLDLLFSTDNHRGRIDLVVRMEKALEGRLQRSLQETFYKVTNALNLEGEISFKEQSIETLDGMLLKHKKNTNS